MHADTRQQIVAAADTLIYEQGYATTSFAHIADAVGISRGNFWHHFKSKDEILDAVIAARLDATRAMLAGWEACADEPRGRLRCFVQMLLDHGEAIGRHGCPVGTLAGELGKLAHPLHPRVAELFALFRGWLRQQFQALGHGPARADALALHLLMRSQGVAVLAQSLKDPVFVRREVRDALAWIDAQAPEAAPRRRRAPRYHRSPR